MIRTIDRKLTLKTDKCKHKKTPDRLTLSLMFELIQDDATTSLL